MGAALLAIMGLIASAGAFATVRRGRMAGAFIRAGLPLLLAFVLFCLADWGLLEVLPHLQISFSPNITPPLLASIFVRLLIFWGLLCAALLARRRGRRQGLNVPTRSMITLFLVVNVGLSAIEIDSYIIEPMLLEVTEHQLAFDDLDPAAPPVRIVHITDTHIERSGVRETRIIEKVRALEPDIIVLTGDYLNLSYLSDATSAAHFRRFVTQLEAAHGVFAVRGSVEPTAGSMAWLVEGTGVVWLEQEAVTVSVRGQPITLVGVACSHWQALDASRLAGAMAGIPDEAFTLLLYHSPDLIYEAAERGVDLYLGGHTHGGQLRLPFYGAIVTGSIYGRRYVSGLFEEGRTSMVISRGFGFEGGGMPRARFLCRPEIVSIQVSGQ